MICLHSGGDGDGLPLSGLENEFNRALGLGDLRRQMVYRWIVSIGTGWLPDHNWLVAGLAIDITNDPVWADVHAQMRTLASRGDRRIKYLISNHQIWEPGQRLETYHSGENPTHDTYVILGVEIRRQPVINTPPWFIWFLKHLFSHPTTFQPSTIGVPKPPFCPLGGNQCKSPCSRFPQE